MVDSKLYDLWLPEEDTPLLSGVKTAALKLQSNDDSAALSMHEDKELSLTLARECIKREIEAEREQLLSKEGVKNFVEEVSHEPVN